jgi:ABC-type nickel/cobalt efflux system permease component RcnA
MDFSTTAPLSMALLGLLMGMRHATDPDHVIAITTIVSRERRLFAASRIGVAWGLGHTLTVLAVGALIILFKIAIPTRLGLAMEFTVAIVLILLGVGAVGQLCQRITRSFRGSSSSVDESLTVHTHSHIHAGGPHWHPHLHRASDQHAHSHQIPFHGSHTFRVGEEPIAWTLRRPLLRSFTVGLVHGLAGSAALALLVLSAIPQPLWATLYFAIFCCGTIIGMGLIATAIAAPFMAAAGRMRWLHRSFVTSSGLLSFGFGLFLAYQLGIVDHLFGAAPTWTPH